MGTEHSKRGFFARVAAFFTGTAAVKSGVADKPDIFAEMDAALKRIPPLSEGRPVTYHLKGNVIWAEHTDLGQQMICGPMGGPIQVYRDRYRWMMRDNSTMLEACVETDVAMANCSGEPAAYRMRAAAMNVGWGVIDAVSKTSGSIYPKGSTAGLDPILSNKKGHHHGQRDDPMR